MRDDQIYGLWSPGLLSNGFAQTVDEQEIVDLVHVILVVKQPVQRLERLFERTRNLGTRAIEVAGHYDPDDGHGHRNSHQDPFGGGVMRALFGRFDGRRGKGWLQPVLEPVEALR